MTDRNLKPSPTEDAPARERSRWRSPRLRVESDSERERHANWLELFFDLVFVFAITELSHILEANLSIAGFWEFALLFVPCWWAWTLVTFYIDRFDADDVKHRVLILGAMLAIIFLAASSHNVFTEGKQLEGATSFALAYIATRSIVLLLYLRVSRHVAVARATLKVYLAAYIPSVLLWLGALLFPPPLRYYLWAYSIAIELAGPILGARSLASAPVHPSHLPERFGLLALIVLGEGVVSIAATIANGARTLLPTLAATIGFGIAACLWWIYFDFLEDAVEIRGMRSVNLYNYGHLPIIMGLALVAVGTKVTITEAANRVLADGARWTLCGGAALFLLVLFFLWSRANQQNFSWQMCAWIAALIGLAIFGAPLPPLAIVGLVLAVLLAEVTLKIQRTHTA
jgi:low temperature requirement protein LtrA